MDLMSTFGIGSGTAGVIATAFVYGGTVAAFAADLIGIPTAELGALLLENSGDSIAVLTAL